MHTIHLQYVGIILPNRVNGVLSLFFLLFPPALYICMYAL